MNRVHDRAGASSRPRARRRLSIATKENVMQFQKGQSGNPAGRPRGSRNRTTVLMQNLLEGEAEAIGRKAIEMAKGGDMAAIRVCMDRLAPARRGAAISCELPPAEAASLARVIDRYMFARSLAEFEHRQPAGLAAT
jgi:Family of unknown function (DUF5681)